VVGIVLCNTGLRVIFPAFPCLFAGFPGQHNTTHVDLYSHSSSLGHW